MIKRIAPLALAAFLVSGSDVEAKAIDIKSVTVESSAVFEGNRDIKEYVEACSDTKLTNSQVLKWFKVAHEEPGEGFHERATILNCVFHGHLKTKDGRSYAWRLDIGGAGYVFLSDKVNDVIHFRGPQL